MDALTGRRHAQRRDLIADRMPQLRAPAGWLAHAHIYRPSGVGRQGLEGGKHGIGQYLPYIVNLPVEPLFSRYGGDRLDARIDGDVDGQGWGLGVSPGRRHVHNRRAQSRGYAVER